MTNEFLPILYAGGDYKNDYHPSALTSRGYIELFDANRHPIDLLYPLKLSLLIEFSEVFFLFLTPIYPN
jgi:hypothetical protein